MTHDEAIARLVADRAVFDAKVGAIPPERLSDVPSGHDHSPRDIVFHITAYEELIVERLRSAREGETTAFDRDRDGWEVFNNRIWVEAAEADPADVLERSRVVFGDLLQEVRKLSDAELVEVTGITEYIDPAWLDGQTLAELIALDGFDHYRMHCATLETAAVG